MSSVWRCTSAIWTVSRGKEKKNEKGGKKQEEAKGQRTCKNPRDVKLTSISIIISICINHRFHGVGFNRMVEGLARFLGTSVNNGGEYNAAGMSALVFYSEISAVSNRISARVSERSRWSKLKNLVLPMPPDCDTRRKIVLGGGRLWSIKGRNVSGQMLNSSPWHHTANMKLLLFTFVVRNRLTSVSLLIPEIEIVRYQVSRGDFLIIFKL